WKPTYKVSREKMNEMRALAKQDPQKYNMRTLSEGFGLNPEAVRRILKSKWQEKDD
ncbi:hypothetical protein BDY24DRAFT_332100, partial [Mrakia frigida]|uniref:uncharacterized protein n=1 Tax=Mrakia frigida TaxID=29902 RepID=UPI003FCC01D0